MGIIAKTLEEAAAAKGEFRAGATDYMDRLRHHIQPGELIDISRIPAMDKVETGPEGARIGVLCSIHDLSMHPGIRAAYPGLAIAAGALATPQIRNAASMGGALLQRNRCWYFRHEGFSCFKKGGDSCPAREGNHQFGVCFDLGPCVSPHPSTLGMALMAYDAEIEIHGSGRRSIAALYGDGKQAKGDHLLNEGEILTAIHLPPPLKDEKAGYFRSIARARAEWPLVEVLARFRLVDGRIADARVAMGGVANVPLLLPKVENALNGKTPSEDTFANAALLANEGAKPLPMTGYKLDLITGTVFETLDRAWKGVWGGEG